MNSLRIVNHLDFCGEFLDQPTIDAVDWSRTDVGEPVIWPQALRAALFLLARTPLPTCVGWGKNLTFFSNAAFEKLHQPVDHPRLGESAADFFRSTMDRLRRPGDTGLPLHERNQNAPDARFRRDRLVDGWYTVLSLDAGAGLTMTCVADEPPTAERVAHLSPDMTCAFHHTGLGVTLLTLNGKCLDANPAFSTLLGYTKPELLRASCQEITHPDDLARTNEAYARIQRESSSTLKIEKRFRRKDGSYLMAQTAVSCVRDLEGRPIAMVVITEDIQERHILQNQLIRAKEDAESANRLKSAFLANMSHEIRTPLGIMMGFSDLLTQNLTMGERVSYAKTLKKNGEQLSVIVNDILDLSKVEAGFLSIEVTEFSLRALLDEVLDSMRPKAAEKHLRLTVEVVNHASDTMTSDPTRLKQILLNVIGNAIKFTHKGGVDVTVLANNGVLDIEVEDSGIGMCPASQKSLFSPFQQADVSITRQYGGTGLGLALSKKLAQLMSGDLILKNSVEGRGSTFQLTIRNDAPVEAIASNRAAVSEERERPAPNLAGLTVLLVEDSDDNQYLISTILLKAGVAVAFANDGLKGFQMALGGCFDLILMDIQMPVMDGYTATQKLREAGYTKPIIALTAHAMTGVTRRCLDVGCNDHLPKPIEARMLLESIGRLLDRFERPSNPDAETPSLLRH